LRIILNIKSVVTIIFNVDWHFPPFIICYVDCQIARTRLFAIYREINGLSCFVSVFNTFTINFNFAWICRIINSDSEWTSRHCYSTIVNTNNLFLCFPWCIGTLINTLRFLFKKRSVDFKIFMTISRQTWAQNIPGHGW